MQTGPFGPWQVPLSGLLLCDQLTLQSLLLLVGFSINLLQRSFYQLEFCLWLSSNERQVLCGTHHLMNQYWKFCGASQACRTVAGMQVC